MWPVTLSGRLPVVALVGHYPTNKLIGREPIHNQYKPFPPPTMRQEVISSIRPSFPGLSQSQGQVTHVLLTRSPLIHPVQAPSFSVRLACVKHAASVRPEPGSNSPSKNTDNHHHPTKAGRKRDPSQQPNTPGKTGNPGKMSDHQPKNTNILGINKLDTLLS